ncbi:MAG: hypothetical protein Q8L47_05390 [bacterium]|nr:hypothetical protein [bacterium]
MEQEKNPNSHLPPKETERKFKNISQELTELISRGKQDPLNPRILSFELKKSYVLSGMIERSNSGKNTFYYQFKGRLRTSENQETDTSELEIKTSDGAKVLLMGSERLLYEYLIDQGLGVDLRYESNAEDTITSAEISWAKDSDQE